METYVFILLAGLFAGFINVIAGGGSMLTLPLLIHAGLPPAIANGTNRVAILAQNIFAIKGFNSKGYTISKFHITLGITATAGAIFGTLIAVDMDGELFKRILGVLLVLFIAYSLMKPNYKQLLDLGDLNSRQKALSYFVFFFIGIYGGLIQAGVGIIIMGALSLITKLNIHKINSIKVVVVATYTLLALSIFIYHDHVRWVHGLVLAAGNSLGGWLAGRYSQVIPEKIVRYFVLVISVVLAVKLWFF